MGWRSIFLSSELPLPAVFLRCCRWLVNQADRLTPFVETVRQTKFDDFEVMALIAVLFPNGLGNGRCLPVVLSKDKLVVRFVSVVDFEKAHGASLWSLPGRPTAS